MGRMEGPEECIIRTGMDKVFIHFLDEHIQMERKRSISLWFRN